MKYLKRIILFSFALFLVTGCDKGFEEVNTNPQSVTTIADPGLLLTSILRGSSGGPSWTSEATIMQQFVLPYNLGATSGLQFNDPSQNQNAFGLYGSIRTMVALMGLVKDNPDRSNLYNMARIWKAWHFMRIVDSHGDVPYSEALRAQTDAIFFPKFDKGIDIYDDLYTELHEALLALDASKDNESQYDIFVPLAATAATEITFWKKMGYSMMLRLGMRYSKLNTTKAQTIVTEAFNGGLMQSNADIPVIANMAADGSPITGFSNGDMGGIRNINPYTFYIAEPIVTTLKDLHDPRLKFISAYYSPRQNDAPGLPPDDPNYDTARADQFGFPVGFLAGSTEFQASPLYRAPVGQGEDYSQINYNVIGSPLAPTLVITFAQTQFLLAEAKINGWLPGGALTAQQYYESGIRASMEEYTLFPNTVPITTQEEDDYIAGADVAYSAGTALEQIGTQYWIDCMNDSFEGWSNFRRTGFPDLAPNLYNDNFNGGFPRRYAYPPSEQTISPYYADAVAGLGGPDVLTTRIFWDVP